MASQRSLYDILNVAPSAEPVVIEAAYRALMKKYHPDQAGPEGAAAAAAAINEAYAVLRSPERRAEYDRRERVRDHQALRAALQPVAPPPAARGTNLFGWSGWLVALIVCGAFAWLATREGGLEASVSRAKAARIAETTPVSRSSQPDRVPPPTAAELAAARAAVEAAMPPPAKLVVVPPPAVEASARPLRSRETAPVRRPGPRKPEAAPKSKGEEADFLEREGYVY